MKARCFRLATVHPVTVNLTGLGDLVHRYSASSCSHTPLQDVASTQQESSQYPDFLPKITLDVFCQQYNISADICMKLTDAKFTGPHTFAGIPDKGLMEENGLRCGDIADLCDGESTWLHDDEKWSKGIWD
jgi:hypothetical protein